MDCSDAATFTVSFRQEIGTPAEGFPLATAPAALSWLPKQTDRCPQVEGGAGRHVRFTEDDAIRGQVLAAFDAFITEPSV